MGRTIVLVLGVCLLAPPVFAESIRVIGEYAPDAHTVALYHLNGDVLDSSGNGRHLTLQNATGNFSYTTGASAAVQNALATAGTVTGWPGGDRLYSSQLRYPGSGDWTVEALVYLPVGYAGGMYFIQHYSEHVAGRDQYRLGYHSGTETAMWRTWGGGAFHGPLAGEFSFGEWHHLAGVYDASEGKNLLYVDGALVGETPAPAMDAMGSWNTYILGSWFGSAGPAMIDEIRISTIARTPEDFSQIVRGEIPEPSSLVLALAGFGVGALVWRRKRRVA